MNMVTHPLPVATPDPRPHAVVIGAGFGGLAAAVRLGARGYRVTVLEKLEQPGGRASVFRQDGFTFDAGPTIITAPFLLEDLWALCGRKMSDDIRLTALTPFYRLVYADGSHIDCSDDAQAMRETVARISPEDVAGYDRFMLKSEAIYRTAFEKLGFVPFGSLWDMAKAVPSLVALGGLMSVHRMVARYIKHPKLRIMLSFHPLFIGGNPFTATSLYCLISYLERSFGVHFAFGGTGALVTGLAGLIEGQGNVVRCHAEVAEIIVTRARATGVRLTTGEMLAADIVVSNADAAWTQRHLIAPHHRRRWSNRKVEAARYSMSLFVWYFGTDRRYEQVPHHAIVLGPRYRELLDDIFTRKVLAADFSLYLHRPTATDPSLAPAGCDTFYVLSPVPNLQGTTDWTREAEPYRQRIERHLEQTLLPDLGRHVVSSRVMTPLDFRDRLNSLHGAAFGLEPVMTQSAWFRPHNRSEDIANLYFVGASTHPGAGVPGVLCSAQILDTVVPHANALA